MGAREEELEKEAYLQYEGTSFLFRFVDDGEFLFDDASKPFKSLAARAGDSNFGADRRRIEEV
jgi:uncharacterized protein (DUF1499 family)